MLTYSDILNIVLIETGQWLIGLEATAIEPKQMELLIKRELALYSRYFPRVVNKTGRLYNGYIFTEEKDGEVPQKIISIRTEYTQPYSYNFNRKPVTILASNWSYEKPKLFLRFQSDIYQYTYIIPHKYIHDEDIDKCGIESLNEFDSNFLNLIIGKFLMTVGRSRRAFVLNDIPFNMDADQLYSEGKDLYDSAVETVRSNSSFQLAIIV